MKDVIDTAELLKPEEPAAKKPAAKKDERGLSSAEFQTLVTELASDAQSYIDESIRADRTRATEYWKGRLPDVDQDAAQEDRSTAVLSEVRDTVLGMMPDMLRIFLSADGVVSYTPVPVEDVSLFKSRQDQAKQATDYVQNIVLQQDNPDSFITLHDAFQDAMVRKTGFIKYWWQKSRKPEFTTYTGLDEDTVLAIVGEDDVEVVSKRSYIDKSAVLGPAVCYDLRIKQIRDHGRIRVQAVPCENIIVSRKGRSIEHTPLFGYHEEKTLSDFTEMGFDAADLTDCDNDPDDTESIEAEARKPTDSASVTPDPETPQDSTSRKIKYSEIYVKADKDGDGIAELIRVVCAGTKYKVLEAEPTDEVQFAAFCPYPEAHEFFGQSVADLTMDIQRIKSRVMRDILDSLAQSVKPQTAVVEGKVNLDDVLNPDTSNIIRQQAPGMVQPLVTPFVGREGLPILDLLTNIREARTGMSDASQGLDPKVLQSTDKDAVQATLTKAMSRIEMVARIFAETGMKRLFRGILKLIVKHQDKARTVELRGKWVTIDPAVLDGGMGVVVNLPLGRGSPQEQLASLMQILAKQEQIIQTLGPDNPLCSLEQYYYTLSKILELMSWRNTANFFTDPSTMSEEQKQQVAQGMAAAKQGQQTGPAAPDPAIEQAKIASNERVKMAELQFKREELATKTQIEMSRIQSDANMRLVEIQATHQTTIDAENIRATVKANSDQIAATTKIIVEKLKPRGGADKGTGENE